MSSPAADISNDRMFRAQFRELLSHRRSREPFVANRQRHVAIVCPPYMPAALSEALRRKLSKTRCVTACLLTRSISRS